MSSKYPWMNAGNEYTTFDEVEAKTILYESMIISAKPLDISQ
jgi:hypothetical protein